MSADIVEEYKTREDYPEGMTFKEFKEVEVYDRVCYVRKMVFKVAVLIDEKGNEHDFFKPEKGKEAFTPEAFKPFPDTNCTPRFMASVLDMRYNLNMPVRRVLKSLESDGMHMCQQSLHNWITFTSEEGVRIAARFYTLVETCKLNGVSPRDYFVKVLEALTNDYGDYEKLTPDRINEI